MGLKVWLPLNGDLHNQGCSNVTIINNGATIDSAGKIGSCYSFASGNKMQTDFSINNSPWSVACWFYSTSSSASSHQYMVSMQANANSSGNFLFSLCLYQNRLTTRLSGTSYNSTNGSISQNVWYHGCTTYDGTNLKIYLNGNQVYSSNSVVAPTASTVLILGQRIGATGNYTGKLNDVRIYNHCLSAAEVREISQGLMLHYKLDNCGRNDNLLKNSKNFTSSNFALTRSTVPENGLLRVTPTGSTAVAKYKTDLNYTYYNNKTYTVSFDAQEIEASDETYTTDYIRLYYGFNIASRSANILSSSYDSYTYKNIALKGTGWQHYSTTITVPIANPSGVTDALVDGSVFVIEFYRRASKKPIEVKNIKLEFGTVDTGYSLAPSDYGITEQIVEDSSGYNHNGTPTDITISADTSRYNQCISFNGSTSNIKTTLFGSYDNLTFSIWFKYSQRTTWFGLDCRNSSGVGMQPLYYNGSYIQSGGSQAGWKNYTVSLNANTWYHYVTTYEPNQIKIYLNGELKQTFSLSTAYTYTDIPITVGARYNIVSSTAFLGDLSDVRCYCTALDADAIHQLYEVGAKIDNKQNLHAFELVENNSKIQITKQGQVKCNELEEDEKTKFYQDDQIIETNEIIEL